MHVKIQGIVTNIYKSQKSGSTTVEITEKTSRGDVSVIQLRSQEIDLSGLPLLQPVEVDAELQGRMYQGKPFFTVVGITPKSVKA